MLNTGRKFAFFFFFFSLEPGHKHVLKACSRLNWDTLEKLLQEVGWEV